MRKTIILMLSVALLACTNAAKQPKMEDECLYSSQQTQFAFWSNVAEQMEVRIYNGDCWVDDGEEPCEIVP